MVRMVVTDLDGTLFDFSSHISEGNLKAIRRLQADGLTFAIASGRNYDLAYEALDKNNIRCEAILGNGSQYVDADGNIIFSCYLNKNAFLRVIECMHSEGLYYMIYTTSGYYTGMDPDVVRRAFIERGKQLMGRKEEEFEPGGRYYHMPCNHLVKIDDLSGFINRDENILKVEAFSIDIGHVGRVREKLSDIPGIACLSSFNDNIEVTDENAQKGLILEKVAGIKGLSKDEIMVVGDGMNDISLFTCFPDHSCAPANADPQILSLARRVVAANTEDGFAEAVNILLDEQGAE